MEVSMVSPTRLSQTTVSWHSHLSDTTHSMKPEHGVFLDTGQPSDSVIRSWGAYIFSVSHIHPVLSSSTAPSITPNLIILSSRSLP